MVTHTDDGQWKTAGHPGRRRPLSYPEQAFWFSPRASSSRHSPALIGVPPRQNENRRIRSEPLVAPSRTLYGPADFCSKGRRAMVDVPNRPEYQSDLFRKVLEVRREVLGADYVDASLARADDFNAAFQQMTTEIAWGMCWTRPGIDRKTRSMINLTMLSALNRGSELRLHLRAALTNGVTRDEIKEILMQVGAYCGIPACLEAFKIATEVFKEIDDARK
jgi:4-carboxymuconolactone decarboxylase